MFSQVRKRIILTALLWAAGTALATAQDADFTVDPAQSSVKFTLGDVLHTVRGTFQLKQGELQVEPDGKVSGQIVVDAGSGDSGSGMRDRKMHKEVLESTRYPEIAFRPDRIDGAVASSGQSSVSIHGMFNIHGTDREITVPAQVETSGERVDGNGSLHRAVSEVGNEEPQHFIFAGQRHGGDRSGRSRDYRETHRRILLSNDPVAQFPFLQCSHRHGPQSDS